uniref:Uncharacterized LOC100180441 n=1 Tax=Ciona intestinalis TaxID=7719 RepID=F7BBB5_CIOIN|nr:uncharacterized protein LOC100180441 [Ciona intestinalis]|eukprot:XP_002120487.1 uncharacterized protein LOC100180441 [Ciona intestinalis]
MNASASAAILLSILGCADIIVATFAPGWLSTNVLGVTGSEGPLLVCISGTCRVIIQNRPASILAVFSLLCLATVTGIFGLVLLIIGGCCSSDRNMFSSGSASVLVSGIFALAGVATYTGVTAQAVQASSFLSYYYCFGMCWAGAFLSLMAAMLGFLGGKLL